MGRAEGRGLRLPAGAEKALALLSEGALFADLYLEATRSLRLVLEDEKLEEISRARMWGPASGA